VTHYSNRKNKKFHVLCEITTPRHQENIRCNDRHCKFLFPEHWWEKQLPDEVMEWWLLDVGDGITLDAKPLSSSSLTNGFKRRWREYWPELTDLSPTQEWFNPNKHKERVEKLMDYIDNVLDTVEERFSQIKIAMVDDDGLQIDKLERGRMGKGKKVKTKKRKKITKRTKRTKRKKRTKFRKRRRRKRTGKRRRRKRKRSRKKQ